MNRNSKVSSQAYKSINGFLIVAKGGEKIHIKEPIRRMQEMFGDEIFRSTIFVFNFASRDDIKKYKEKILESDILKEIKKIQPDFSFKNQTFFNYKFDEKKLNDQFMEYKDSERSDLLKRIKSLTPYESDTYLKYIERIEQIRTKEAK